MRDQADELRQLVLRGGRDSPGAPRSGTWERPRLVAVCGSQAGVGATTVALNVSIALVRAGRRAVYVDAGERSAFAASVIGSSVFGSCAIGSGPGRAGPDGVLGSGTNHELLLNGPGGIRILPHALPATGIENDHSQDTAQQRLISELKGLGQVDAVLLDAGCGTSRAVRRFCQSADHVILVTTGDMRPVLDAYATMKVVLAGHSFERVSIVVNRASDLAAAEAVHKRLSQVCGQFLGWRPRAAGYVLTDPAVGAGCVRRPFLLQSPASRAARGIRTIAETLLRAAAGAGISEEPPSSTTAMLPGGSEMLATFGESVPS